MYISRIAPAVSLLVLVGCVAPPRSSDIESQREWARLCGRLRPTGAAPAPAPRSLTSSERSALRRTATGTLASVVLIHTDASRHAMQRLSGQAQRATGCCGGTGVIVSSDGVILTNAHVVRGVDDVIVEFSDGRRHPARRIVRDAYRDLAVLSVGFATPDSIVFGTDPVGAGTAVVAVGGVDLGSPNALRVGVVTDQTVNLQNELDPTHARCYDDLIECNAAIELGFSGGPLLDRAGRLVGLNVAVRGAPHGDRLRGLALPMSPPNRRAIRNLVSRIGESAASAPTGQLASVRPR